MTPSEAVRTILRYAVMGLAVILTAFVIAFWLQQDQVREVRRVAGENRRLIAQVDRLNRTQADQAFRECTARNDRARASVKAFGALVAAHRRDGNPRAAAVWQGYLDQIKKTPIPPCKRPNPN